jgi:hypothetical protein
LIFLQEAGQPAATWRFSQLLAVKKTSVSMRHEVCLSAEPIYHRDVPVGNS